MNSSSLIFDDLVDEANFSTKIIEDINLARENAFHYVDKLNLIVKKITQSNGTNDYLTLMSNNKPCSIKISKGILSIKSITKELSNFNRKLELNIRQVSDYQIFDLDILQKQLNFLHKKG